MFIKHAEYVRYVADHLIEGLDHGKERFKRCDLDAQKTSLSKDRLQET